VNATPGLEALRTACRRVQQRGDDAAMAAAQREALAAVVASGAAALAPRGGDAAVVPPAAAALLQGAAVEAAPLALRHAALATAALVRAFGGRSVQVWLPLESDVAPFAERFAPAWAGHGVAAEAWLEDGAAPARLPSVHGASAGIVVTTARRALLQADGAAPPWHLLADGIDRLLLEEAVQPIGTATAEDATDLAGAVMAARAIADALGPGHLRPSGPHGRAAFTPAGAARLEQLAGALPPLWRTPARREALVQQALHVRDHVRAGAEAVVAPGGQLLLDERLLAALPDPQWATGLVQAVQARLDLPLSPVVRTAQRASIGAWIASARGQARQGGHAGAAAASLAGTAASLRGAERALRREHRLGLWKSGVPAPWPRVRVVAEGSRGKGGADGAGGAERAVDEAPGPRLVVVRRPIDAVRRAPAARAAGEALLVAGSSPDAALAGLPPGSPGLHVVFDEPLASARDEAALLARVCELTGLASVAAVSVCAAPSSALFGQAFGARLGPALVRATVALPAAWHPVLLPALVGAARQLVARALSRDRRLGAERERLLRQQLAFATVAAPSPSARAAPGPTHPAPHPPFPASLPSPRGPRP
jgi:hypothetical protein